MPGFSSRKKNRTRDLNCDMNKTKKQHERTVAFKMIITMFIKKWIHSESPQVVLKLPHSNPMRPTCSSAMIKPESWILAKP